MPIATHAPLRKAFLEDLGFVEIIEVVGAGPIKFSSGHKNPVVFVDGVSAATLSAFSNTGVTTSGACTLLVIG